MQTGISRLKTPFTPVDAFVLKKKLTMVGMLLHLLAGGIRGRRSGLRLMLIGGLLLLDTPPGDIMAGDGHWLL